MRAANDFEKTTQSPLAWRGKARILQRFLSWQALVQFLSALSGLILVHLLGKTEFALYTLAASVQTTLSAFSDSGVGTGMISIGGRVWENRRHLSRLTATALRMRSYLLLGSAIIVTPLGAWLLHQNGAPGFSTIVALLIVIATVFFLLNTQILAVPLRLHGEYHRAQRAELLGASARILFTVTIVVLAPNFVIALTAALIGGVVQARHLKVSTRSLIDDHGHDEGYAGELQSLVKSQAIQSAFFAFQGQISVWLMSLFGTSERVAEVGALSRLAILFSFVSPVLVGLVSPAFARAHNPSRLRLLFFVCLAAYAAFSTVLLGLAFLFPQAFLWILGSNYRGLVAELPLSVIGAVIGGLISVLWTLPTSRGVVRGTWMIAASTVMMQIVLLRLLDLSSVRSVLLFNIFSSLSILIVVTVLAFRALRKSSSVETASRTP